MDRIDHRMLFRPALVILLLALSPGVVWAHTGVGSTQGFGYGFAHPLLGWDHLLAMVAVGLWAAQTGGRALWALPAGFVATMIVGGVLGALGTGLPGVEAGILASVLVLGGLIAAAARFPVGVGVVVVALFALFHGHAHGAEMPAAVTGLAYGAGFALATALLHAVGIAFTLSVQRVAKEGRTAAWVRLAGAAIGVAGLALWLV